MPCEAPSADPDPGFQFRLEKDPDLERVYSLYREAGWIKSGADVSFVEPMIRNSFAVACAFDRGRLIGMMRALSDGVSDAYLLDLVVDSAYRRHGIGKKLLDLLTNHMASLGVDWIVCIGAPGTESFYRKTAAEPMGKFIPYRFRVPE